jgi:hypothetical protein
LELLSSYGVTAKPTTIKNPQANAFVERIHQVMSDSIRTMELDKRKFDDTTLNAVLQSVDYGLRSTYHSSLAASPSQIIFGCWISLADNFTSDINSSVFGTYTKSSTNNISKIQSSTSGGKKVGNQILSTFDICDVTGGNHGRGPITLQ